MPDFTPTPEQQAIVEAARDTDDNLAVVARAGAAKTSTLVLIAEALPDQDILCLAFNKSIAQEMTERLPPNCEAKTLHALGYKAWYGFTRKSGKVNDRKIFHLLREEINGFTSQEDRDEAYSYMSETMDFIKEGKQEGWLPEDYKGHWKPLIGDEDFWLGRAMEPTPLQKHLVKAVSIKSFAASLQGELDFNDMIFCPAICSVSWPTPSVTLVDEAQDLSDINHHILKKLVKNRRLIAVGDPCQAIYGFRGANEKSMEDMAEKFSTVQYNLTISFRCAHKITENAQWRAPDMRAPEWAEEGVVKTVSEWSADDLELGDAIICRNNAPLFAMAVRLLKAGKLPEIAGRDIGTAIRKIMKKLGSNSQPNTLTLAALDEWKEKELKRARAGAKAQIYDRYECIKLFLEETDTLGDAIFYLDSLLMREGRIHLMTGHKSKGLEFDNVWFLDQHLCNIERGQDANIKYVIETRPKRKLIYCTSDCFAE